MTPGPTTTVTAAQRVETITVTAQRPASTVTVTDTATMTSVGGTTGTATP